MKTTAPRWATLVAIAFVLASVPAVQAAPKKATDVQEYTGPAATTEAEYGYFVGEAWFGPVTTPRLGFVASTAPAEADRFTVELADDTGLPVAAWLAYRNPQGKTSVTLICGGTDKSLAFDPEGWVTVWPATGRCDDGPSAPTHGEVTVTYLSD